MNKTVITIFISLLFALLISCKKDDSESVQPNRKLLKILSNNGGFSNGVILELIYNSQGKLDSISDDLGKGKIILNPSGKVKKILYNQFTTDTEFYYNGTFLDSVVGPMGVKKFYYNNINQLDSFAINSLVYQIIRSGNDNIKEFKFKCCFPFPIQRYYSNATFNEQKNPFSNLKRVERLSSQRMFGLVNGVTM
jgi:hypothetical protein